MNSAQQVMDINPKMEVQQDKKINEKLLFQDLVNAESKVSDSSITLIYNIKDNLDKEDNFTKLQIIKENFDQYMVDPIKMEKFLTTKESEFTLKKQKECMAIYYSFVSANLVNVNLSFPKLLNKDSISLFQNQIKAYTQPLLNTQYDFTSGQNLLFIKEKINDYEIKKIDEIFKSFLTMLIFEDDFAKLKENFNTFHAGDYYKTISFSSFIYSFVQEYLKINDYISFNFLTEATRNELSKENNLSIEALNKKIESFNSKEKLEQLKKNFKALFVLEINRYRLLYPDREKRDHFLNKYQNFINIDEILVSLRSSYLYKINDDENSIISLIGFIKKTLCHIDPNESKQISKQNTFEEIELLKYVLLNNKKTKITVFENNRELLKTEFKKEKEDEEKILKAQTERLGREYKVAEEPQNFETAGNIAGESHGFFDYIGHFFKTIFSGILKFFNFIFHPIIKLFK